MLSCHVQRVLMWNGERLEVKQGQVGGRTEQKNKKILLVGSKKSEIWDCEVSVKVSAVTRDSGQDGQTPASERRETVPLMICRSSRLIAHTPLCISLFSFFSVQYVC